jgi:hypothetical protein
MYSLGMLLHESGRPPNPDRHAMHNLGLRAGADGRSGEASRWQRRAGTPPSSTGTGLRRRSYSYRTPPEHSAKQPDDTP